MLWVSRYTLLRPTLRLREPLSCARPPSLVFSSLLRRGALFATGTSVRLPLLLRPVASGVCDRPLAPLAFLSWARARCCGQQACARCGFLVLPGRLLWLLFQRAPAASEPPVPPSLLQAGAPSGCWFPALVCLRQWRSFQRCCHLAAQQTLAPCPWFGVPLRDAPLQAGGHFRF